MKPFSTVTCAPIACNPATCKLTGLAPMAQPPGSDTSASPKRLTSGPRTNIDARIVLTSSYGARRSPMSLQSTSMFILSSTVTTAPMLCKSEIVVVTSFRWGTLLTVTVSAVSRVPARIGKVAFFAPDILSSPSSWLPPDMSNLSNDLSDLLGRLQLAPFVWRVGTDRHCVYLIAH